jgi:hypothetical protein
MKRNKKTNFKKKRSVKKKCYKIMKKGNELENK